jgi:hypothetical protein
MGALRSAGGWLAETGTGTAMATSVLGMRNPQNAKLAAANAQTPTVTSGKTV